MLHQQYIREGNKVPLRKDSFRRILRAAAQKQQKAAKHRKRGAQEEL
jgi:hypothetical protein